jgi:ferric-dicitrate binding protein FerR (iron transport regulator)
LSVPRRIFSGKVLILLKDKIPRKRPNAMKCQEAREHMSAWLDDEVDGATAVALAAHVDRCETCRLAWLQLQALDTALGSLMAPVPLGLADNVLARIQPPRHRKWLQSVALAACLVLGIALGGTMAHSFYTPVGANGTEAEVASLEVFQDFPQGSLGAVVASYQPDESNGNLP